MNAPKRIWMETSDAEAMERWHVAKAMDSPIYDTSGERPTVQYVRADIADGLVETLKDCAEWLLGDIKCDHPRPGLAAEMRAKVNAAIDTAASNGDT